MGDLDRSRRFYEQLIGLVVTDEGDDVVYLRGVEEVCHHSLVLQRGAGTPECLRVGFRVRYDEDLDRAHTFFGEAGLSVAFTELPHQERTLWATDPFGLPLELCATMETRGRNEVAVDRRRGAAPTAIDHCQAHVLDVDAGAAFYADLGFRTSECITMGGDLREPLVAAFMARKGNANDLVLVRKPGPRLHHFSYAVHEAPTRLFGVCDLADALGLADCIEWGPARHGAGNEAFLYLRDPDGHRVELLSHPYRFMDPEEEPVCWSRRHPRTSMVWGPPPPSCWHDEATPFAGADVETPAALEPSGAAS